MSKSENHLNEYFHNPYAPNSTKFFNLNDDCILDILHRLSLLDLCNVRDTCKRLRILSEYYFNTMYRTLNFNSRSIKSDQWKLLTQDETKTILMSFGHQIDALTLNADSFSATSDEILQTINDYCSDQKLQHLKLIKFAFDDDIIENCQRLFSIVEKFTINKCYGDDKLFEKLFNKCTALKNLELLRQFNIDGTCLQNTYPNLEGFALISNDNFDPLLVNTFFTKNPQLKVLKLIGCNFVDDEIFPIISDHLINLESLSIRLVHVTSLFEENVLNLLKLQHLRKLEFNCGVRPINAFINGLAMTNTIECLGITSAEITVDLCSALGNLKNLQTLKLISMYDTKARDLKLLAVQLTKLNEFHLVECEAITFDEMMEFIEHSQQLEKLVLNQCCKVLPIDSAQFIRLAECCQKRVYKHQLIIHMDYSELLTTKEQVSSELRHEYASIVQLAALTWEDTDYNVSDYQSQYFAEEGGAYDLDFDDDNFDDDRDDDEFNDPYNVWNDDFDDEDLYPF